MNLRNPLAAIAFLGCLLLSAPGASALEKEPSEKTKGKVYEWTSSAGLAYQYHIPRSYDPEKGASLTVILHGSNLDHRWGFANHKPGEFRPDDIVVSPNGTTSNGNGGFNFMGKDPDIEAFGTLLADLRQSLKINATYLYGHSQGSFFALHYAGARPAEVQGVVAHASGVWTWTLMPDAAKHQAIVFLHGTADPVVPYGQSLGGYEVMKKIGYPTLRVRSLEGWNHWPAEHNGPIPHTSQQLAWCEGMTTTDNERLKEVLTFLLRPKAKEHHDFAGLYQICARVAALESATPQLKGVAQKTMASIDELVAAHAKEIGDPNEEPLDNRTAIGHLPIFLRAFGEVPSAKKIATAWEPILEKHRTAANESLGPYWKATANPAEALSLGTKAIKESHYSVYTSSSKFTASFEKLIDNAREHGLDRDAVKEAKSLFGNYQKALEGGKKEFESQNKRARL